MARARRFAPRVSARLTQWLAPANQGFIAVASGGATIIASVGFEEPVTIMRNRGMVSIKLNDYSADLDIVGAYGMGVVSTEAFIAGVASIPEPFTDADWGGWFVWRSFGHRFESVTNVSTLLGSWSFEVDSKAMRKVRPNETIVEVCESQVGSISCFSGVRTLVKLS